MIGFTFNYNRRWQKIKVIKRFGLKFQGKQNKAFKDYIDNILTKGDQSELNGQQNGIAIECLVVRNFFSLSFAVRVAP